MTTEAKVGAFVIGCFSILAFTVIYLVNAQFSGNTVSYRTYLRYAGGLEPGASVLALLAVSTGLAVLILGVVWFAFFRT